MIGPVLRIDGIVMPDPSSIVPLLTPMWATGSTRMADGVFEGDIQAYKWRFDVSWQPVTAETATLLYQTWMSKAFHTVEVINPKTNKLLTFTAYTSEITSPVYSYAIPNAVYESLSFSIVEK